MSDFTRNETAAEATNNGGITLASLANERRWVAWQTEDGGKPDKPRPTKVLYDPTTGRKAKSNDSTTWATRAEAEACAAKLPKPFGSGGVGLCFGELHGLCLGGADFDTCLTDGRLAPWAAEAKERIGTYTEVSPSGGGAKCFFSYRAEDAVAIRKQLGTQTGRQWKDASRKEHPPGIELYISGRFFAVTDERMDDAPAELREVDVDTLAWLIGHAERTFPPKRPGRPKGSGKGGDNSRSARAMSAAARLKRAGGSYDDFKAALRDDPELADWLEEKGLPQGEREARRTWGNAGQGGAGASAVDLLLTKSGEPVANEANALRILTADARWDGVLAFDEFAQQAMFLRRPPTMPGGGDAWTPRVIADPEVRQISVWLQENGLPSITVAKVFHAVDTASRARAFHPVKDYLDGLRWDGTERLDKWLTTYVGADDNKYTRAVGPRWMIGAVARIYRPGCKLDTALILEGPQRLKKSTTAAVLGAPWFTDTPQDLHSKDAMQALQGVWVVELAELAGLGKAGQNRIKAFMSSATDRFRATWDRLTRDHPRQCAFIGTYNPEGGGILKDPTGGSRWWPVKCGKTIKADALRADRDQLWAEAVQRFRAGERWWIEAEETALTKLAEEQQEERYEEDEREAIIGDWAAGQSSVSVSEALEHLGIYDRERWTQKLQNLVAHALTRRGWKRQRESAPRGAKRPWKYYPPEEPDEGVSQYDRNEPHTGTHTGTRGSQEHQRVSTLCPSSPSSPSNYQTYRDGKIIPDGAHHAHSDNLINSANRFGDAPQTGTTGTLGHGEPVCTRQHCPGRWAEAQENQRVCRCPDPHCHTNGLVTRRVPVAACPSMAPAPNTNGATNHG
jgi:predicted P-loop ATPase